MDRVDVLELVDEHELETALKLGARDRRWIFGKARDVNDQVIEVDRVGGEKLPLIGREDLRQDLVHRRVGRDFVRLGAVLLVPVDG